jgi:site-specific recombinase XerD
LEYKDIPQYARDFLNYMETIKGTSKLTTKEYYYDLRIFFEYIFANGTKEMSEVTLSHIYEYLSYLTHDRGLSAVTRGRKIASLQSFFKYIHKKSKLIKEDPTSELETPKVKKELPKYLNLEESKNLLKSIEGKHEIRDNAILTLFLNCGLRLAELVSIDISRIKDDRLTIVGKGNKERTVYLNNACKKAIDEYITVRPSVKAKDKNALFLSERYERINRKTVQWLVKKYIKVSGLDTQQYSTHKLRHTCATLLYKHGDVDIRALQSILGHTTIATTQIYTHVDNEQIRDAVAKNPLAEL